MKISEIYFDLRFVSNEIIGPADLLCIFRVGFCKNVKNIYPIKHVLGDVVPVHNDVI